MLKKRTFTDEVTGEELATFFESEPFVVDGITYVPPDRYFYNPHPISSRAMFVTKDQNFGYRGNMVRRVNLSPDSELVNV